MKYNVTKSDVTNHKKIIEFVGRNLTENEAVNILFETHGTECCKLFQDVTDIVTDNDNMIYFEVTNNKRIFRYEIEVSQFEMFAAMFRNPICSN